GRVFRDCTITGAPEVLNEVKLTAGNSLGGWMPHMYGSTLPPRMMPKEATPTAAVDEDGNQVFPDAVKKEPKFDWVAKDGEITGSKADRRTGKPQPSALAYFRPMRPGETLRYEFFHEPGKTHVHPGLGRLAFLLEPEGVKLHWLTDGGDDWTGLPPDNAVSDSGARGKLSLKAGDWNTL